MRASGLEHTLVTIEEIRGLYRAPAPAGPIGRTLADAAALAEASGVPWCLAGTLVLGAYATPMATDDVDIHLLSEDDAELVKRIAREHGFKPIRPHTLEHIGTGVEFDLVTPEWVRETRAMYERAIAGARPQTVVGRAVPVPGPAEFAAIKLRAGRPKDQAHVVNLLLSRPDLDLGPVADLLTPEHEALLTRLRAEAERERRHREI